MAKVKIKDEPVADQLQLRYREDPPEIDNNEQYYQVGSISDQVQAIWDEEEIKPKVEQIGIDPNRQVVINLDRDFIRKNYRAKWIDHVLSTYRRRGLMKACQVCYSKKIIFDSPAKLVEHYKEFHQEETTWYDCSICYYRTKRKEKIILHWGRYHKDGRKQKIGYHYRLKRLTMKKYIASRRANDPNNIWIGDVELVHSMFFKEPLECDICLKIFCEKRSLNDHKIRHLEEHEIEKWYECDQCDKRFRTKRSLKYHFRNIHKEKFSCVFCSNQYPRLKQLRQHELIHRNEMLTCEFCDMKFIEKRFQYIHYRKLHFGQLRKQDKFNGGLNKWFQGSRTFECYRCRYMGHRVDVKGHMENHCKFKGNNTINCKDKNCIRRFDSMRILKTHFNCTHNKTLDLMNVPPHRRTFECHICRYTEKGFKFNVLRKHLRKEHPEENKCDICNATFPVWSKLENHKLIHGEKLFKCKYCQKKFYNKYLLGKHEKIHTKPVKCENCDFRCAKKVSLMKHLENHCAAKKSKRNVK